jgi:cytochrome c5
MNKDKATYTTLGGRMVIEMEFATTEELVEKIAHIQDVCEQEKCTHCNGNDFRFVFRTVGDDKYYELECKKCHFKLGFGIPKKGERNLYPRRKNQKTKAPIGPKKDGWHYFDKNADTDEED